MPSSKKIVILGTSGHASVVCDIAKRLNYSIIGFLDDKISDSTFLGYPILGNTDYANQIYAKDENIYFLIAIGSNQVRKNISQKLSKLKYATLIHPAAIIAENAEIGDGSVVMAAAIVNPLAKIGSHCIINTASVIEHEDDIADYVHISPNAALGGNVKLGKLTHIGIGACVKNNVSITSDVIVGAGASVVKDIVESGTYVGVPAKKIK